MSEKRNTVLPWFKKWMKPTELQFKALFNYIWFKDEMIPVAKIDGLDELLQSVENKLETKGGLTHVMPITVGITSVDYPIPDNAMLYAFECNSDANITITNGTDEINWNTSDNRVLGFGLSQTKIVSVVSDVEITISPILYFKASAPTPPAPSATIDISDVTYQYKKNSSTGTSQAPVKNDIAEFGIREIDGIEVCESLIFKGIGDANSKDNWIVINEVEIN